MAGVNATRCLVVQDVVRYSGPADEVPEHFLIQILIGSSSSGQVHSKYLAQVALCLISSHPPQSPCLSAQESRDRYHDDQGPGHMGVTGHGADVHQVRHLRGLDGALRSAAVAGLVVRSSEASSPTPRNALLALLQYAEASHRVIEVVFVAPEIIEFRGTGDNPYELVLHQYCLKVAPFAVAGLIIYAIIN